jgi:hypothetical protein
VQNDAMHARMPKSLPHNCYDVMCSEQPKTMLHTLKFCRRLLLLLLLLLL